MVDSELTALVVSGTGDSGQAIVRTLAEAGGTVGYTYNTSKETAQELLEDLPGDGHEAWQCDVTEWDETSAVVDEAIKQLGELDAVIYTVGVISQNPIQGTDSQAWQNHLDANLTGAYNLLRAVSPTLQTQSDGAFVAISASQGVLNNANFSAYDASKQGLEALVQEAARELGPHGVRANVVAPGFIRDPDALSDEAKQDLLDGQPYDRITKPQDIANACLFLCSEEAATVTGAVLPVDSGLALTS